MTGSVRNLNRTCRTNRIRRSNMQIKYTKQIFIHRERPHFQRPFFFFLRLFEWEEEPREAFVPDEAVPGELSGFCGFSAIPASALPVGSEFFRSFAAFSVDGPSSAGVFSSLFPDVSRLSGFAPVFIFADAGPGCVRGACPEGKMTCGTPYERVTRS